MQICWLSTYWSMFLITSFCASAVFFLRAGTHSRDSPDLCWISRKLWWSFFCEIWGTQPMKSHFYVTTLCFSYFRTQMWLWTTPYSTKHNCHYLVRSSCRKRLFYQCTIMKNLPCRIFTISWWCSFHVWYIWYQSRLVSWSRCIGLSSCSYGLFQDFILESRQSIGLAKVIPQHYLKIIHYRKW